MWPSQYKCLNTAPARGLPWIVRENIQWSCIGETCNRDSSAVLFSTIEWCVLNTNRLLRQGIKCYKCYRGDYYVDANVQHVIVIKCHQLIWKSAIQHSSPDITAWVTIFRLLRWKYYIVVVAVGGGCLEHFVYGCNTIYYSEKAWACVQNGITQRGRLADGDMTTSP